MTGHAALYLPQICEKLVPVNTPRPELRGAWPRKRGCFGLRIRFSRYALFLCLANPRRWRMRLFRLVAISALLAPLPAMAEEDAGKNRPSAVAPMPPIRPTHWPNLQPKAGTPPTTVSPASPLSSGPPASPIAQPTATMAYPDHGPMLPAAPRSRMHECGEEWQNMKASGAAAEKTWRAFAQACLIR